MPNEPMPDLDCECNVVFEYGQAMAAAAESLLRYPDRMQNARSEDERAYIRASHATLVKRTVMAHRIAFAVMTAQPNKQRSTTMHWIYKGLMAVAVVGGALVTGGILPIALAPVAVAVGTAAGFFHDSPSQGGK